MNLVWFRSDLRIHDNPALSNALANSTPIQAVFIVTLQQWIQHAWGANKIGFVLSHVIALQQELAALNIKLDILYTDWFKSVPGLLTQYAQENGCRAIYYNQEYELNEKNRDLAVEEHCKQQRIGCFSFAEQCLIEPGKILNKQDKPYSVFTPFKKAYYQAIDFNKYILLPKPKKQKSSLTAITIPLRAAEQKYLDNPILKNWPAGEKFAQKLLHDFCNHDLLEYKTNRDFPALDATSRLSAYLAVGAISIKSCFIAAVQANDLIFPGNNPNIMCWIDELIWRDFYRNVMVNFPDICKGENYNKKYDRLKWRSNDADFNKWASGATGIPILDAAMRQLVQTGWMHNRLRMITAMFLTKQLLIDWRLGEKFFSEHLVDLDFSSNNGGWQWCASTGTDAVPYFRIFNPVTQSQRFDPQGEFIRKYCPELKQLDNKQIHNPSAYCNDSELIKMRYTKVMIDLAKARARALDAYNI